MAQFGYGEVIDIPSVPLINPFEELLGPSDGWDTSISVENSQRLTNAGNEILRSADFAQMYEDLVSVAASHMGFAEVVAQASPTFRIQLPGTKSVSFHTDDISSGHGREIANFWLPLSSINEHNCLHLVPPNDSQRLLKSLKNDKLSLAELDRQAREVAKPVSVQYGEMVCFSNEILHGTTNNISPNVRVSLDFRCLPPGADSGSRILGKDFLRFPPAASGGAGERAISVVYQSFDVSHIGHGAQRSVVNEYASRNGFSVVRETSEWHGLNHFPVLEEIMSESPASPILLFSSRSYDWENPQVTELMESLKRHSGGVHFCLENEKL